MFGGCWSTSSKHSIWFIGGNQKSFQQIPVVDNDYQYSKIKHKSTIFQ